MRRIFAICAALVMALASLVGVVALTGPAASARLIAGECVRIYERDGIELSRAVVDPALCAAFDPTATTAPPTNTAVPPTATMSMPMPTSVATGWHAPTTHEHGDAPPAWVLNSGNPPFTQTRESHEGYKGTLASDNGGKGVQSYLITHILSTTFARSHGDHDFQIWFRAPTGQVFYTAGILDFGSPPALRTNDTGQRPIILSVGDGSCETWYNRPGANGVDMGWTICGRVDTFAGAHLGNGTFRTVDWLTRPPVGHPLRPYCTVEFGVCRISFLRANVNYNAPGIVPPN